MPDIWMDVDIALAGVPVNHMPLIDSTDFVTIENAVAFDAAGMALFWHFSVTGGVTTQTAVTPTSSGVHDWTDQGDSGLYTLEIPASGGTINNDTEGTGWFTGKVTGVLAWTGPKIGFRAAALNNALIDGGDVLDVNLTEMGGVSQSATDLKDFADAGYDPATNKVQGVVLVDTTTTNTDMRGTDSALLSADISLTAGAVDNVTLVATTTTNTDMRGTDSAATSAKQDTMETTLNAIPTTAMRGTDNAATSTKQDTMETTLNAIPTTAMRGTDGANTVTPDAAGVVPTAIENRQEMDSNSTKLADIVEDTGITLPALIDDLAIKKNTAFSNFEFLMVLTSDGRTPATGLTVTGERSIDGGAFSSVSGTIAEVSNGIYQFDALAADTNGDVITWRFLSATADDTFVTFKTVA